MTTEGDSVPRYYSLASGVQNGFVEICVRNVPGGLCSGQLHSLKPGDHISAAFQANPGFRLKTSKTPVIPIGAGAGIAPLVGFIRNNKRKRPMRLYFGLRHPQSDFLYRQELGDWHKSGFLHSLKAAFSQAQQRLYVQDRLRQDAGEVAALVRDGAQIRGTRYSAIIMREDTRCPEGLERALFEAVDRVDRQMSTWKPEFDLVKLNRTAAGVWTYLPEELFRVLEEAIAINRASSGLFDPALGDIVDVWGFGASSQEPDAQMIRAPIGPKKSTDT
nr:FAD:protein FMN transferase [uncultured Cohaesibacter sp.]